MDIKELPLEGCFVITPKVFHDERGTFVKSYHEVTFSEKNLNFSMKEEFYSISKKNVFRGMHFQLPPAAHSKLVYCAKGEVQDYLVDLRKTSKTYGKHLSINLSEANCNILYIPVGIAHGFLSLSDESLMVYKTDHVYSPELDSGILWSSCNLNLQVEDVLISNRDTLFNSLDSFESPFS